MAGISLFTSSPIEQDLLPYTQISEHIQNYWRQYRDFSGPQLQQIGRELKLRATDHDTLATLLPEAYALLGETCRRLLGLTAYPNQLTAAVALHYGNLIEMPTGEGKTLTALFPAYLNALIGKGVHILTFNDYLAQRDAEWAAPVFQFLGLSIGAVQQQMPAAGKAEAYQCDITYATAKSAGFDFLRDQLAYHRKEQLLRPFFYAIVDEADALMIDEARNPLVLAGTVDQPDIDLHAVAQLISQLQIGIDFDRNDYDRNIFLTEKGIERLEAALAVDNLLADEQYTLLSAINLALHAQELFQQDVDYVVKEEKIWLVDEFTGRIVPDRKWRNGLQAAVEAKEGLPIRSAGRVLNAISLQHFIYQYPKLAGMTATARSAAEEFENFYGLRTVVIPPHRRNRRIDHEDQVFVSKEAKQKAIIQEVERVHQAGRPMLIGTLTVRESEELGRVLAVQGIDCQILNANNDALEAAIIAQAGRLGRVTISTNMAGRGTDIQLGGGDAEERKRVLALGGLYVLGTNRHESCRIDRQLRGRAGRQGDIGESRFFVSMEDELMIKYQLRESLPKKYRQLSDEGPVHERGVLRFIDHIQRVMEGQAYDMRRTLLLYSDLIEKQRQILQQERQRLLDEPHFLFDRIGQPEELPHDPKQQDKLLHLALGLYDRYWSEHLDQLQQLRESIYLVRYGGQKPLREYQRYADQWFHELYDRLDTDLLHKAGHLIANPSIPLTSLGIRRPASTWTYVINDNPFGNQLAIMLLDNSNIGFQADFISAIVLFFVSLFRRRKRRK